MPALLFEFITISTDVIIFVLIGYYILKFRKTEKELARKEEKVDTDYHKVVDSALARERKIIEDATDEASEIIEKTEYLSNVTKQKIDTTLHRIVEDIEKDATSSAKEFTASYDSALKKISTDSLSGFQNISKNLEEDLRAQIKNFHDTLLPSLERELEEYKAARIKATEEMIMGIVQRASQEILNKSISITDHQKLVVDALEKAKKEGVLTNG